jgi:hypothetical protein
VSYTGDWHPGPLEDQVGLLGVRVGMWNHMAYPEKVPAAGEHDAEAIKAGHGAITVIDEIIRGLHELRGHLVTELRADEDERAKRVDAMVAGARCAKCRAEPCKPGSPFGQRCLDMCHEALEFDHCCMICATPEEARALGFRIDEIAGEESEPSLLDSDQPLGGWSLTVRQAFIDAIKWHEEHPGPDTADQVALYVTVSRVVGVDISPGGAR